MLKISSALLKRIAPYTQNTRSAKPFPGKCPTRIFVELREEGKKPWIYNGKPSRTVKRKLDRTSGEARHAILYTIGEYDRGGWIVYSSLKNSFETQEVMFNQGLWDVYHPNFFSGVWLQWLVYPFTRKGNGYMLSATREMTGVLNAIR